ncbi:hypothetical protein Droror1_Dr00025728 [Drosera rotundifolia]
MLDLELKDFENFEALVAGVDWRSGRSLGVPMLCPRVKGEEAAEMMMLSNESLKSNVDDGVCCNETKFSCIRDDKATKTNWYQQGHGELEALSKGVLRNFEVFASSRC